ncbi:MAG: family peptidase [Chlorobi bacterium]|nr:family peptidase [Chlorobiota bacterium]
MSQTIDRTRPPKPGKQSQMLFPTFALHTMKNGIPVYVVENHAQPYISLQIVIRSGASSDGELPGLAEFTSNLLLSGAGKMSAQELAEEIDYLGASLDASAGRDETTIGLGVLSGFLPRALSIMADVVLRPTFPADEVQRERKQSIAALKQHRSDPAYLASVQFRREIHGDAPYGREIDGNEDSLRKINRAECSRYHQTYFTAGNAFFVAAGDVQVPEFLEMLEEHFGQWGGDRPERMSFAPVPGTGLPRIVIVDRPDSVQSALRVGAPGLARRDPDYIAMITINTLFGGYFNSRINNNLRERNGYTYGARSLVDSLLMPGTISVAASVGTGVTEAALREIFNELESITAEPVSETELEMVKSYIIGSQALQIETPGQVASFVRAIALFGLPHDYYQRFPAEVRELTREQLLDVARRYMRPDRMVGVIAGDARTIREKLEDICPVKVVNERGEEITV